MLMQGCLNGAVCLAVRPSSRALCRSMRYHIGFDTSFAGVNGGLELQLPGVAMPATMDCSCLQGWLRVSKALIKWYVGLPMMHAAN